jgi:hypothetical protein
LIKISIITATRVCGGVESPKSSISTIDARLGRGVIAGVAGRVTGRTCEIVFKELSDAYAMISTVECSVLGTRT